MRKSLGKKQETKNSVNPLFRQYEKRYAKSFVLSLLNENFFFLKGPVSAPIIVICLGIHRSSMCALRLL